MCVCVLTCRGPGRVMFIGTSAVPLSLLPARNRSTRVYERRRSHTCGGVASFCFPFFCHVKYGRDTAQGGLTRVGLSKGRGTPGGRRERGTLQVVPWRLQAASVPPSSHGTYRVCAQHHNSSHEFLCRVCSCLCVSVCVYFPSSPHTAFPSLPPPLFCCSTAATTAASSRRPRAWSTPPQRACTQQNEAIPASNQTDAPHVHEGEGRT